MVGGGLEQFSLIRGKLKVFSCFAGGGRGVGNIFGGGCTLCLPWSLFSVYGTILHVKYQKKVMNQS